jgi:fructose-1,6-bisphosphatase
MKLKFKNNVTGFIYDSENGDFHSLLHKPVTDEQVKFFNEHSGDDVMFADLELIIKLFNLDDEDKDPEYINRYWGDILEVVL